MWDVCIQTTRWMPRQIAFSETFRSKLEEIQTQAPPLRSWVCPAMENARSINANYIRGGVNEFSNPLPSNTEASAISGNESPTIWNKCWFGLLQRIASRLAKATYLYAFKNLEKTSTAKLVGGEEATVSLICAKEEFSKGNSLVGVEFETKG
jgi:hypothetical protein